MRIIERDNIDRKRWNELVRSKSSSFFSLAWYLDATADNWCVLVNEDYTAGIALPYTKRAGIEILYTPIFVRYVEWIGGGSIPVDVIHLIQKRFKIIELNCKQQLWREHYQEYIYQVVPSERKIGSQAKRSLKKANVEGLTAQESNDYDKLYHLVMNELNGKHDGLTDESMKRLRQLISNALDAGVLHTIEITAKKFVGGIFCLEDNNKVLYLKGTVEEQAKKNGGMYLALDTAIQHSYETNKIFDFGGSRAPGVMKFNHNLGGEDVVYYVYKINNGPKWFSFLRAMKNKWRKK